MLSHLQPKICRTIDTVHLDDASLALVRAAEAQQPLEPVMAEIVRGFGFETFLYAMTTEPHPSRDSRSYYWANQPQEWIAAYEANAYVEVDPRITLSADRVTPLVWDAAAIDGDRRVREYLNHAAQYGIRSGVVCAFRHASQARMGLILNSSISPVSERRLAFIHSQLGRLMLFSANFHELFMSYFVQRGTPPIHQGSPLSPRELQCLALAARGMTSADIGIKLGITERTANFHFCNIISKLGVLNRQEAIAQAVASGKIKVQP
jgi:LuxR family transcriptional regulator, quorum-sensing system regulator LasR